MDGASLLYYRLPGPLARRLLLTVPNMLSNIRKYTGLMFVVLILLFVGLVFMEGSGRPSGYGSGPTMIEIDGGQQKPLMDAFRSN